MVTGPSGAGKTVFLRMIADLDPNEGKVWLASEEREGMPATRWRRLVTYVPAESGWWADTVQEHFQEHFSEAAQAEIGLRVKEIMDKAKEGTVRIKASIQAVADLTTELGKRLDVERQARQTEHAAVRDLERSLTDELRELRRTNDELSARVAELERPRGLRRLCLWLVGLFRRGKR